MIDPKRIADLDQCLASCYEVLPSIWWEIFEGCKEKGFTEEQAMRLVEVFIRSSTKGSNEQD